MDWETTVKESPKPERPRRQPTLRVLCVAGRVVRSAARPVSALTPIGRAVGDGGIQLEDPRVSRLHAVVELDRAHDVVKLSDRSSTGTELAGERVSERELRDGDVIVVGGSALVFHHRADESDDVEVPGLLGDSPPMRTLRRMIGRVATSQVTVLLSGETGTGKEVVARAIHEASARRGEFVAVNSSAIPATLAESQLFGHVAGSYTGARADARGVFRAADGGTLFLDELGDLPLELQPKLLRALEERAVTPVGQTRSIPVDVRVVAATHRDLVRAIGEGGFRGDLYARLSDFTLHLPPLRERREDVLLLLRHFYRGEMPPMESELLRALLWHPWPFNVRELVKVAAQLELVGQGADLLTLEMLGGRLAAVVPPPSAVVTVPAPALATRVPSASATKAPPTESPIPGREELEELLRKHRGVIANIARETGRSRKQVYRWVVQHGLDVEAYRAS